jgi:hypothetical protein
MFIKFVAIFFYFNNGKAERLKNFFILDLPDHSCKSYEQPTLPTSKSDEVDDLEGGAKVSTALSAPLSSPQLTSTPSLFPPSQNADTHVLDITTVTRTIHRCRKCNDNYKPSRAHHDSVTGRCIVKMDHFCPWVGNAIGALNHKFFLLFIFYTFISCSTAIPIVIIRILPCRDLMDELHNLQQRDYRYEDCQKLLAPHAMVLIIVTILFFFFTLCMLADQILAVTKNVSKIARLKIQGGDLGSDQLQPVAVDFNEIFGVRQGDKCPGTFRVQWHWFVPLPVEFPPGMKDVIMGYRYVASLPCNEPWWPPEAENSNRSSTVVEASLGIDQPHGHNGQVAPATYGGSEILTRRLTPSTLETERLVEVTLSEHQGQYA